MLYKDESRTSFHIKIVNICFICKYWMNDSKLYLIAYGYGSVARLIVGIS